jgi:hypothetical protein
VIVSPVFGAALLTVLRTWMSATPPAGGLSVALELLLLMSGSVWSDAVTVAVFVIAPGFVTVAVIVSVALAPLASAPMIHAPEVWLKLPVDGSPPRTPVRPAANPSPARPSRRLGRCSSR